MVHISNLTFIPTLITLTKIILFINTMKRIEGWREIEIEKGDNKREKEREHGRRKSGEENRLKTRELRTRGTCLLNYTLEWVILCVKLYLFCYSLILLFSFLSMHNFTVYSVVKRSWVTKREFKTIIADSSFLWSHFFSFWDYASSLVPILFLLSHDLFHIPSHDLFHIPSFLCPRFQSV